MFDVFHNLIIGVRASSEDVAWHVNVDLRLLVIQINYVLINAISPLKRRYTCLINHQVSVDVDLRLTVLLSLHLLFFEFFLA